MASLRWLCIKIGTLIALNQAYGQSCNYTLTGEGNITSPNYPAVYPNSASCGWSLTARSGTVIQLFCRFLDVENGYDYLTVTSPVPNKTSSYSYRLTGNSTNCFWTLGSTVTVTFTSDGSVQRPGFVIGFRSVPWPNNNTRFNACGGRLNDSGVITSPNYPNTYPSNSYCIWNISARAGNTLRFYFYAHDVENAYDFLTIYNSPQIYANQIIFQTGAWSSSWFPAGLPAGSAAVIVFMSDATFEQGGFSLGFWSEVNSVSSTIIPSPSPTTAWPTSNPYSGCSYSFIGEGNITSPNYPAQYPNLASCIYNLTATPGKVLQLFCRVFDTEANYDYLTITSRVSNKTTNYYYRLSGYSTNCSWTVGSAVTVTFTSDGSVQRTGFVVGFRSVPAPNNNTRFSACGGRLNDSGVITSPNYPNTYPSNSYCVWNISARAGNTLRFYFYAHDVENAYDFLTIYNSPQINTNQILFQTGAWSSSWFPSGLSAGSTAVVVFTSDATFEQGGFSLGFWSEGNYVSSSNIPSLSSSQSRSPSTAWPTSSPYSGCSYSFIGDGNITSPNYPAQYPNFASCIYNLTATPGKVLQLFCRVFDTEANFDYLTINSRVPNKTTNHYYRLSGNSANCSWTLGSTVTVTFTSDGSVQRPGFVVGFRSVPWPNNNTRFNACGGRLNDSGVITSPNYPNTYPRNSYCVWNISARAGNTLRFYFYAHEVENAYDFLTIYNSPQINANQIIFQTGTWSSSWFPSGLSAGSTAVVVFTSDATFEQGGFSLGFWSDSNYVSSSNNPSPTRNTLPTTSAPSNACGGNITGQGIFASPLYPGLYPNLANCVWRLKATTGKVLQIDSLSIDLEDSYDTLSFNTTYPNRTTVDTFIFSGNKTNVTLVLGSEAIVIFRSDGSVQRTGFRVSVSSIVAPPWLSRFYKDCKMIITSPGIIFSPGYPSRYPTDVDCQWAVRAPVGSVVKVQLVEFSTTAYSDVLRIFQEENVTCETPFTTYTGLSSGGSVVVGRTSLIAFSSNSANGGAGFRLLVTFILASATTSPTTTTPPPVTSCGATFTGSGRLTSPNYPSPYKASTKCVWKLNRQLTRPCTLRINRLSLEAPWDNVRVYATATPRANDVPVAEYTGNITGITISFNASVLTVIFNADESIQYSGFDITFYSNASSPAAATLAKPVLPSAGVCGVPNIIARSAVAATSSIDRIVGGVAAQPTAWPWQAMLFSFGSFICGGSLISSQWVVTAAHCIGSLSPQNYNVSLGKYNRLSIDTTERRFPVEKVIRHPAYDTNAENSDIALIKLLRNVTFTTAIKPICLPRTDVAAGTKCFISGWGDTKGTGSDSVLRQASLPVLSGQCCRKFLGSSFTKNMTCAGNIIGGIDTCQGDSGGPLVCNVNGTFWLYGVTSWGIGCGRPFYPGVYTRVSYFTQWITDTISVN